jgi:hypothetical protein
MEKSISKNSSKKMKIKKENDFYDSESSKEEEEEVKSPNVFNIKKGKELYDAYKRDLGISEFTMKKAIKSVGEWVINFETQRNLQMRNEFDEEKEYKLEKQKQIENQIEEISNDNDSDKMIKYFNEKISQQENLLEQYTEIKNKIDIKIKSIKEMIPNLEKKANSYKAELKKVNRENLKLMEQINEFEKELSMKLVEEINNFKNNLPDENTMNLLMNSNSLNSSDTLSTNVNNSQTINGLNYSDIIKNITMLNNKNFNNTDNTLSYSTNFNSINIQEILEKNEKLRKKQEKINKLKEILKEKKMENDYLMKNINQMNNNFFKCKKVYNEGMHEIAKELLKINEMELDKVINNSNTNFNSLYFDIFKTNYNSGQSKNDLLRLPIINSNINKKFKYPIMEKSEPNDLLYKVIKNIIEENNTNNKINNMKKNKFSWDEFKDFSAYQIYTLLNINKDILKKLEACIFPTQVVYKDDQ